MVARRTGRGEAAGEKPGEGGGGVKREIKKRVSMIQIQIYRYRFIWERPRVTLRFENTVSGVRQNAATARERRSLVTRKKRRKRII